MDDETPGELALIPGDGDSKRTNTTLTNRLRDAGGRSSCRGTVARQAH